MIKTKNVYGFLYHWHQRIGLVMGIVVIAWALSGFAHPIISRLNPKPVAPAPNKAIAAEKIGSFAHLVEREGIKEIQQLRLFQWQDQPVYRIQTEQGSNYYSAQSTERLELTDFDYADYLARHFTGEQQAPLKDVALIESFNDEYLYINRYLPVIKLAYARDDNLRAFIDPALGRLATLEDTRKSLTGTFFRNFHSWVWIENLSLRRSLMSLFLVMGFVTAAFGFVIYIQSWRKGMFRQSLSAYQNHPRTRRWHRTLGVCVALFAMGFTSSGLLHLWMTDKSDAPQVRLSQTIDTQGIELHHPQIIKYLAQQQVDEIQLVAFENQAYWRIRKLGKVQTAEHHHHHHSHHNPQLPTDDDQVIYFNARNGEWLPQGWQRHAQSLALALTDFSADQLLRTELVESFSGEYGFINKRLPVHALHFSFPGKPAVYVETASNTLASQVVDSKRVEGFAFAYIHKWHFLDFIGKDLRDAAQSAMAFLILSTLLLGYLRYFRTRKKRIARGQDLR
jgi:uncharacterized iron-regulated membrane protein